MNEDAVLHNMIVLKTLTEQSISNITQARELDILSRTPRLQIPGGPQGPSQDQCKVMAMQLRAQVNTEVQTAVNIVQRFVQKQDPPVAPRLAGLIDDAAGGTNGLKQPNP